MEDHLERLPAELLHEILTCLGPKDLLAVRQVNTRLREIASSELLWKRICEERNLLDFTPSVSLERTPFSTLCIFAKIYLSYEKILKKNWKSYNYHDLHQLSAATTESISCWQRMLVRTYEDLSAFDIFRVDNQCKVHRVQRIDTRFEPFGAVKTHLNEHWLAASNLNAVLLYYWDSKLHVYTLKWVLMLLLDDDGVSSLKALDVNEHTSLEQIDHFLSIYYSQCWLLESICLYANYIWIVSMNFKYYVINLNNVSKEASFVHVIKSNCLRICNDEKLVCVVELDGVALYQPNAELLFKYDEGISTQVNKDTKFENLTLSPTTVAFVQHVGEVHRVILINRISYQKLFVNDMYLYPETVALHQSKPWAFVMLCTTPYRVRKKHEFWIMKCYSCINGDIIWQSTKIPNLPFIHKFEVIRDNFILLTPLREDDKLSLFDCNSGNLLTIIEEKDFPITITDTLLVCIADNRSCDIIVKCML